MRILVLGGTGFLGAPVVGVLERGGHSVAVFHRGRRGEGRCEAPHFHGEQAELREAGPALAAFDPEVVIDFLSATAAAARRLMATFPAVRRLVVISSMDVYRACGVFHGVEPGPPDRRRLDEFAPLRQGAGLYPASALERLARMHGWLGEGYDKVGMERELAQAGRRVTILRLPLVYGPGDRQHRLYPLWKRMHDERPVILMQRGWAEWRSPRGFVDNIAAGIALAATASRAAGRIYNLAEAANDSELEWAARVGKVMGWRGRLVVASPRHTPAHLRVHANTEQSWIADSSRIRNELGYREPVAVAAALAAALDWQARNQPAEVDAGDFNYAAEDRALQDMSQRARYAAG